MVKKGGRNTDRYYSYNKYLREKYGCKLYKLALSISDSCPNRDGKCGTGGCIFCSEGSGEFASKSEKPLEEQIADAKKLVESKNKSGKYIAYFQSFTSTYIPYDKLENALKTVIEMPEIMAISVATRADCLDDEVIEILEKTAKKKDLTIELGLQTSNEKTANLINRCCPLKEFSNAANKIKGIGAELVYHIILGLPYETTQDMISTVKFALNNGADGLKLQLLHVLRGTLLYNMYKNNEFKALEKEEYFSILSKVLEIIPKNIVIHRLTGDGAKRVLEAPLWSADKKRVLNDMNKYFEEHNVIQGSKT